MRVLLVERNSPERGELERALLTAGTDVLVAGGGEEGLARVGADGPDVVVVGSELPDMDPLRVCRRLREAHDRVPVLVMSAEGDPISALNAGADDFMPRGSSIGELHARLRALTRRSSNGSTPSRLEFEELELDLGEHSARIGERVVRLTRTEFELLHLFMRNPRRVLPTGSSTSACGATTSRWPATPCACTWATCGASSRRTASGGCCTPFEGWDTY